MLGAATCAQTHSADVTGVSLQPTGEYFISTSDDRHYAFSSIETGQTLAYVFDFNMNPLSPHPPSLSLTHTLLSHTLFLWPLAVCVCLARPVGMIVKHATSVSVRCVVWICVAIRPMCPFLRGHKKCCADRCLRFDPMALGWAVRCVLICVSNPMVVWPKCRHYCCAGTVPTPTSSAGSRAASSTRTVRDFLARFPPLWLFLAAVERPVSTWSAWFSAETLERNFLLI